MQLTIQEVEHIAELAKLDLTVQEIEQYREQLSAILDYAEVLQNLDTSAIPPTASVLPGHSALREDVVLTPLSPEDILKNAPQQKDQQFEVPIVMENGR